MKALRPPRNPGKLNSSDIASSFRYNPSLLLSRGRLKSSMAEDHGDSRDSGRNINRSALSPSYAPVDTGGIAFLPRSPLSE